MCLRFPFTDYHDYPAQAWVCNDAVLAGDMSFDERRLKARLWYIPRVCVCLCAVVLE